MDPKFTALADPDDQDQHVVTKHAPPDIVEVDEYAGDATYAAEVESYASSLASNPVTYNYIYGRRYQSYKEGAYLYPNDEEESARLDITHKMIEAAMDGKLYFAPIENPKRVLDMGAGNGIWAIEFSEQHTDAQILGNDLSPIQPAWVPPNVTFEVDDIEALWTYTEKFDFIHSRCLGSAVRDWPNLIQQTFDYLNPGGYAEFVDFDVEYISPDDTLEKGSDIHTLNNLYIDTTRKAGIEPCPGKFLESWMKEAGFKDVTAVKSFLPLGTWPSDEHMKTVGAWNYTMVTQGLEGFLTYVYATILGKDKDEIDRVCAAIRKQLLDSKLHCMYTLWICYGRKPMSSGNK